MIDRISKHNYYLDIAQTVSERSTCIRRRFGCVIVNNDSIISTGYNGAPRGRANCNELNTCVRDTLKVPRGERYELCRSVHAEANAIISAAREHMIGSTLYMCCTNPEDNSIIGGISSCAMCKRLVINAGISTVITRDTKDAFTIHNVTDWISEDDIEGTRGY